MEAVWRGEGSSELPLVVSYFTDADYLREAWELARSCQAHGLAYEIVGLADRGGWRENTNAKPTFLLEASKRHPDRALLWLDADARVRKSPELFRKLGAEIAYRTWHKRPASGTVFLAPGARRDWILERWIASVERDTFATDQVCMGRAVAALGIEHYELPVEYCWIYDFTTTGAKVEDPWPAAEDGAVIEHMQASRFKRKKGA